MKTQFMKSATSLTAGILTLTFFLLLPSSQSLGFGKGAFVQQQMWRQQQAQMRRQQQAQMRAAQQRRAAEQRRRQEQARQQRLRQQQQIRARNQQRQAQIRARQQNTQRQRQQSAKRQRDMRLRNQIARNKKSPSTSARAKAGQNTSRQQQRLLNGQQSIRQQRLARERQERLRKLRLKRDKDRKKQKDNDRQNNTIALASIRRAGTRASSVKNKVSFQTKDFKSTRASQAQRPRITQQFDKVRNSTQLKLKRIRESGNKLRKASNINVATAGAKALKTRTADQAKVLKAKEQFRGCRGKATCECSFHGDTPVLTESGYKNIRDLQVGVDRVWARNEFTGDQALKPVIAHFSSNYDETVTVETYDRVTGIRESIRSNRIHPYFVESNFRRVALNSSNLATPNGRWIQAQNLRAGDRLSSIENDALLEVVSVTVENTPLQAFNITVDDHRTFFVGMQNDVWVHNTCDITNHSGRHNNSSRSAISTAQKTKLALKKYNDNDKHHLFGRGGKTPNALIKKYGSPEKALKALQKAAQPLANNNYKTGSWVTVKVGKTPVTIQGKVVDGLFRISSIAKRSDF
jgi:hypothetical protein